MPLGDKAKAVWPLRATTLKQQAMITQCSGKAESGKLVWNQHKSYRLIIAEIQGLFCPESFILD